MNTHLEMSEALKGPFPVVPTPFDESLSIDFDSLGNLLERLCEVGIPGLTILGSSSETTFLTDEERRQIAEFALEKIQGKLTTIVGIVRWGTKQAIEEARMASDLGADAVMVALPQYYRTPLAQVISHYETIVIQTGRPVLYYHYPETTHLPLTPDQIGELFEKVDLAGIKESGFSTPELKAHMKRFRRPVKVFTGQSFNLFDSLKAGAVGAICPAGILMPKTSMALCDAVTGGDTAKAMELQERLFQALPILSHGNLPDHVVKRAFKAALRFGFKLPKPPGVPHAGLKEALASLGVIRNGAVRSPQPALSAKKKDEIQKLASELSEL